MATSRRELLIKTFTTLGLAALGGVAGFLAEGYFAHEYAFAHNAHFDEFSKTAPDALNDDGTNTQEALKAKIEEEVKTDAVVAYAAQDWKLPAVVGVLVAGTHRAVKR